MRASLPRPAFSAILAMATPLAALAAPPAPLSQPRPEWHADLEPLADGLVTTLMDQSAVAGAVVAIVSADEVLLQKGCRLADLPSGPRVDAVTGAWVWGDGRYLSARRPPFPPVYVASGGFASTGGDMVRFMQAQLANGRTPWPERITDQMRAPLTPGRPEFTARTWAYWHETWAGCAVFHHDGAACCGVALAAQLWALYVLWQWNILTLSPLW